MLALCFGGFMANESVASEPVPLTETEKADLVNSAIIARSRAYAPYSKYLVGAALLTDSGKIFTGCNVENAAYGSTICAERTAVCKAVSEGEQEYRAVAVVLKGHGTPCGACRQVLNEFNPDMIVIMADIDGVIHKIQSLKELLPDAFGPHNLQ